MSYKFTIAKKGYEQNEVDRHIQKLEKELEEYKHKEGAISKSLVNAEIVAIEIITSAEIKAKRMINDANEEIGEELDSIEKMIYSEKKALEDFCHEYDELVKNYFNGSAIDITAPLREKINLLECIIKEKRQNLSPSGEKQVEENEPATEASSSEEQTAEEQLSEEQSAEATGNENNL